MILGELRILTLALIGWETLGVRAFGEIITKATFFRTKVHTTHGTETCENDATGHPLLMLLRAWSLPLSNKR
jgi:hypothetical protein